MTPHRCYTGINGTHLDTPCLGPNRKQYLGDGPLLCQTLPRTCTGGLKEATAEPGPPLLQPQDTSVPGAEAALHQARALLPTSETADCCKVRPHLAPGTQQASLCGGRILLNHYRSEQHIGPEDSFICGLLLEQLKNREPRASRGERWAPWGMDQWQRKGI